MGTVLTTVLITAPLAFMAGWLLGKALFRHLSITRPNPAPAQPKAAEEAAEKPAKLPSGTAEKIREQLASAEAGRQAALNDARLLKEAVAEREHQLTELRRRLQAAEHKAPPEHDATSSRAIENVQQAKEMRALEQRAAASSHELADVRRELVLATNKLEMLRSRSRTWLSRFKPVAKQVRQQRLIISELREELRQRELQRKQEAEQAAIASHKPAPQDLPTPPPVVRQDAPVSPAAVEAALLETHAENETHASRDNLEDLKGIGPALHRKLNDKGVFRLQQLAEMTSDEVTRLGRSVGVSAKLLQKHDWRAQARAQLGLTAEPPAAETLQACSVD